MFNFYISKRKCPLNFNFQIKIHLKFIQINSNKGKQIKSYLRRLWLSICTSFSCYFLCSVWHSNEVHRVSRLDRIVTNWDGETLVLHPKTWRWFSGRWFTGSWNTVISTILILTSTWSSSSFVRVTKPGTKFCEWIFSM